MFTPVVVSRGRKFRGHGFLVATSYTSNFQYSMEVAKIWVPAEKRYAYANADFTEDDPDVDQAMAAAAFDEYTQFTIHSTIKWCRTKKPNASEAEILGWARTILMKHHPDMATAIDASIPAPNKNLLLDSEIREKIASTLEWAKTLRTKTVWMYGRWAGGKPYTPDHVMECARKALTKKGLTEVEDFTHIFADECRKAGLMA